ncbi:TPA: transcriptional regulator [Pseudomonas aeruginosa]
MSLRPTLALLALISLPLMAAQNDPQPSSKELMKEHQAQIQNDLADVDYKRKRIVEANMNLTDQEGEKFWPIYNTYRTESDKLSKETLKLLLDYAQAYNSGNVSDDQASKLIERVDDLQEDRLELRDKYVKRIAKNVSPKRAMRFLQIEIQLDAIATLEIGRQVPLVE